MQEIGNRDPRVSRYKKVWISTEEVAVVGVWGPGTSKELSANWASPFEGMNINSVMPTVGAGVQASMGYANVSTLNTRQTWESNRPTSFNVEFKLYALEDADAEVMQPIRKLETFFAPDVKNTTPLGGHTPDVVCLNIGGKHIYTDMIINDISMPFDKEVDRNGNFVRATLNIQLSTLTMVTKTMLEEGYGLKTKQ